MPGSKAHLGLRLFKPWLRPPSWRAWNHPLALFALTVAAHAIGATEFVIAGLLPTVAQDLGFTLPLAGLIVSAYALVITALTTAWAASRCCWV